MEIYQSINQYRDPINNNKDCQVWQLLWFERKEKKIYFVFFSYYLSFMMVEETERKCAIVKTFRFATLSKDFWAPLCGSF